MQNLTGGAIAKSQDPPVGDETEQERAFLCLLLQLRTAQRRRFLVRSLYQPRKPYVFGRECAAKPIGREWCYVRDNDIERRSLSGKPRQGKPGDKHKAGVSYFALKAKRSIHYPAYYMATCQNGKITPQGVSFYYLFVSIQPGLTPYRAHAHERY